MYTTAKLAARHSLPSRADDARTAGKLPASSPMVRQDSPPPIINRQSVFLR